MAKKRAVLFVNGELEDPQAAEALLQPGDLLVAVDGGLHYLAALGRTPDVLIGDLDSITPAELAGMEAAGVRIVRYPAEKDDTDLELAIRLVIEEGYQSIRLLAALGGRIDQTLGNLFLLAQPAFEGLDLRILSPGQEIFLIRSQAEISGQPGDTLSLLPLLGPAVGVTTQDLYYPLRGETLYPYRTRGISNVMLEQRAVVSLEQGTLLCVHFHPEPVFREDR